MGTYGTGIYSCDTAEEVRDFCAEVYPILGVEEGNRLLYKEFDEIISSDMIDNDYASFWYALADWQWNHGILNDEIKNKTAALLRSYTGIDEWESDSPRDVKKRMAVLDGLLKKIESPMPKNKLKIAKMKKPKHKVGDIVIIKACDADHKYAEDVWRLEYGSFSYLYAPKIEEKLCQSLEPPLEAYNKYIALLCVGSAKVPHSVYIDGYYDEHSIYAVYNYLSDEKPTVDTLRGCGFIPKYVRYSNTETNKIEVCRWDYKTTLLFASFRAGPSSYMTSVEKISCPEEAYRFDTLISKRGGSTETDTGIDINDLFSEFFYEKERHDRAGIPLDDLLKDVYDGPELLSPVAVSKMIREECQKWLSESSDVKN